MSSHDSPDHSSFKLFFNVNDSAEENCHFLHRSEDKGWTVPSQVLAVTQQQQRERVVVLDSCQRGRSGLRNLREAENMREEEGEEVTKGEDAMLERADPSTQG